MAEPDGQAQFTLQEFIAQVDTPVMIIDLRKNIPAFILQKFHKIFRREIGKKCRTFIGKAFQRPKLPLNNLMASISFQTDNGTSKVCFRLKDLYCTGILKDTSFYEARGRNTTSGIVPNSIPLGNGSSYGEMLGRKGLKPTLGLSYVSLVNSHQEFLKLGTKYSDNAKVLQGLKMVALIFMEPCRQDVIQRFIVGEHGRYRSTSDYAVLEDGEDTEWGDIRSWGKRSLCAEGLKREDGVLTPLDDKVMTLEQQKNVLIILSNNYIHQM